jgi:hypothetical protein
MKLGGLTWSPQSPVIQENKAALDFVDGKDGPYFSSTPATRLCLLMWNPGSRTCWTGTLPRKPCPLPHMILFSRHSRSVYWEVDEWWKQKVTSRFHVWNRWKWDSSGHSGEMLGRVLTASQRGGMTDPQGLCSCHWHKLHEGLSKSLRNMKRSKFA